MAVLDRWGRRRDTEPDAVVFVTRNLDPGEQLSLYGEVESVFRESGMIPMVVPCDEMGVCPEFRGEAQRAHGLPAYFFGVRSWLRHKLLAQYGCRVASAGRNPAVDVSFERVELAEERLRTAEAMLRSFEAALGDVTEEDPRLSAPRAMVRDARNVLESAMDRYQNAWLATYGVRMGGRRSAG